MRRNPPRVCLALALATAWPATILAATTYPADDGIPLVNWAAPPYWMAPAAEGSTGSKHLLSAPNPSLAFHAVTPCRIADTRGFGFTGPYGPPNLTAGAARTFAVTSPGTSCGIPSGVKAVSFNFAVTNLTANGNLVAYPTGVPAPTVSSLNWTPSEVAISNAAVVALGSDSIDVLVNGPVGSMVDLIIDVNGYYGADPVVTSLNGSSGALSLVPSGDIAITPGAPNITIGTNAVSTNTPNTLVRRDASGNFAAANITAASIATSATIQAGGGYKQPGAGGDVIRIVRGNFDGTNGSIFSGAGTFSVTRNGPGDYTVNFATGFTDFPALAVTPMSANGLFLTFSVIGTNTFHIITRAPNGVPTDSTYVSFVAVGNP